MSDLLQTDVPSTRRRRLTLEAMCIAQGMTLLDVTIVNTVAAVGLRAGAGATAVTPPPAAVAGGSSVGGADSQI
jgi:hypothetical protein